MANGKRIGYVRVSTTDQNPDRQLEGIELDKKFIDYASASTLNRPQLNNMLEFIREDDIVIVHSMDRLARNLGDLRKLVDTMIAKQVKVHFIKENLLFDGVDSPMSNLLLSLMGAFAEFEHQFIRERQMEGIRLAKKAGKFKGRQSKMKPEKIEEMRCQMALGLSKSEIASKMGISRGALYKYLKLSGWVARRPFRNNYNQEN